MTKKDQWTDEPVAESAAGEANQPPAPAPIQEYPKWVEGVVVENAEQEEKVKKAAADAKKE